MRETRLAGGVVVTIVFSIMGEDDDCDEEAVGGVEHDKLGDFEDEDKDRDLEALIICRSKSRSKIIMNDSAPSERAALLRISPSALTAILTLSSWSLRSGMWESITKSCNELCLQVKSVKHVN